MTPMPRADGTWTEGHVARGGGGGASCNGAGVRPFLKRVCHDAQGTCRGGGGVEGGGFRDPIEAVTAGDPAPTLVLGVQR